MCVCVFRTAAQLRAHSSAATTRWQHNSYNQSTDYWVTNQLDWANTLTIRRPQHRSTFSQLIWIWHYENIHLFRSYTFQMANESGTIDTTTCWCFVLPHQACETTTTTRPLQSNQINKWMKTNKQTNKNQQNFNWNSDACPNDFSSMSIIFQKRRIASDILHLL